MAKLGEVCKVSPSTKNIERQGAWLLNLDMVEQQTGRVIEYKYVGEDDLNGSIIQFDTENVLYSKLRPNLNKVVLPPKDGFSTSELLPLRPDASVLNKDYLAAFLRSDSFVTWAVSKTAGAKMPRLGTKDLMNAEIPVPSIEQQKKIAEKFKKLEQLISLRKQQLAKLDELVKARFVEMFGDPVSNPLHWKKVKLSELADIKIGPFGSLLHKEDYVTGGHPLVNPSHIINGKIIVDNDLTLTEGKYFELSAYRLKKNDVVLGRRGEMGRCAVVDEDGLLCGTGSLLIRTNGTVTADYIQKIISFPTFKKTIEDMAVGQTMPNLNVPIVSNFMIIVPPLSVQKDYYDFVECVDQQKQTVQQSLDRLELMKKAMMQEYFG